MELQQMQSEQIKCKKGCDIRALAFGNGLISSLVLQVTLPFWWSHFLSSSHVSHVSWTPHQDVEEMLLRDLMRSHIKLDKVGFRTFKVGPCARHNLGLAVDSHADMLNGGSLTRSHPHTPEMRLWELFWGPAFCSRTLWRAVCRGSEIKPMTSLYHLSSSNPPTPNQTPSNWRRGWVLSLKSCGQTQGQVLRLDSNLLPPPP